MKGLFDTAVRGTGAYEGKAWFFKGDSYVRYKTQGPRSLETAPKLIVGNWGQFNTWPGSFASGVDLFAFGAIPSYQGKGWFFKADKYIRYNLGNDKVEQQPQTITGYWGQGAWPSSFGTKVDASIHGVQQYAGKIWFFRGPQFFRFDIGQDNVETGVLKIADNWGQGGWPKNFSKGIDLAMYAEGANTTKIYFFSGDRYITYDLLNDVVEHSPHFVRDDFPGLAEGFYPSGTYWGIDSLNKANHNLGGITLYDFVTAKCGIQPAFWGRYLSGLDSTEIQYIHERQCRILLIFNGITQNSLSQGFIGGVTDAQNAIALATNLGVPTLETIYGDIEPGWTPTRDWFIGWWVTFATSIYREGIYYNGQNPSPFTTPYADAYALRSTISSLYPQVIQVPDTNLWAQFPQKPAFADFHGCPTAREALMHDFTPLTHSSNINGTGIWQFKINCLPFPLSGSISDPVGQNQGNIDNNLATQGGYDTLWDGSANYP